MICYQNINNLPSWIIPWIFRAKRQFMSSIFWNIKPSSSMKLNRRFGGICSIHLQDRSISEARSQRETGGKQSRLHGVISKKIELHITTAVRTSNHATPFLSTLFSVCLYDTLETITSYHSHLYIQALSGGLTCDVVTDLVKHKAVVCS
jgi:hypothetical protein